MTTRKRLVPTHLLATVMQVALLLVGCSAPQPAAPPRGETVAPAASGPKVIRMAVQTEFAYLIQYGHVPPGNPGPERFYIFHSNFTTFDEAGNPQAQMTEKVPSIQDGDWKVNPDGTMEVTWKIRPNVSWHDGSRLTADDFVFGYQVVTDPRLIVESGTANIKNVTAVRAPDAQTFVVNWGAPWIFANSNNYDGIPALKRDQIEPLYQTLDPAAFADSQVWRADFIGLGPFRLTEWALGSHITAEAFDQFYLGRPKIDRLEIHWTSVTVLVARLLAGTIDTFGVGGFGKGSQLVEIHSQKGPNWGTWFLDRGYVRGLRLNFREDSPWGKDVRFRQAIAWSLDRQAIAEAVAGPFAERTDYVLDKNDLPYKLAEQRGVPQYSYDPARAAQLFAAAGWAKGSDGLLRNAAGQTVDFPCCRYGNVDAENTRESLIWVDALKSAGIDARHPIPAIPAGLTGIENRKAGAFGWAGQVSHIRLQISQSYVSLTSAQSPSEETRWTGLNSGGYLNPAYDSTLAERMAALPLPARQEKELQLIRIIAEDLPFLPVHYLGNPIMAREGITGVTRLPILNDAYTMNIHQWAIN